MAAVPNVGARAWTIRLDKLSKSYSSDALFQDLDMEIWPGKAVHIQGANGSGKTQLMLVIAGLVAPNRGQIRLQRRTELLLSQLSPDVRSCYVRYVPYLPGGLAELPMDLALLVMTRQLHTFSLKSQRRAAAKVMAELKSELRQVCDGAIDLARPLANYSVGQQKRFGAAAALCLEPSPLVVMIDEPLAGLDSRGIEQVINLMCRARQRGISLLVSEHRAEISRIGFDQVLQLPYRPNQDLPPSFVSAIPPPSNTDRDQWNDPVLRLTDATSGYIGCPVRCPTLTVAPGQLVVIRGANGSGKTGFVRGLLRHAGTSLSGQVELNGLNVTDLELAQRRNAVRYLSQIRDLFLDLTVQDSILVAGHNRQTSLMDEIGDVVRFLGPRKLVRHLSSGGKALLGLVQALAGAPQVLILDEPTANTDAGNRRRVWELLNSALRRERMAILVIEHDMGPIDGSAIYGIQQGDDGAVLVRLE